MHVSARAASKIMKSRNIAAQSTIRTYTRNLFRSPLRVVWPLGQMPAMHGGSRGGVVTFHTFVSTTIYIIIQPSCMIRLTM